MAAVGAVEPFARVVEDLEEVELYNANTIDYGGDFPLGIS